MRAGIRDMAAALLALLVAGGCAEQQANIVIDSRCSAGARWAGLEGDQAGLTEQQLQTMAGHNGAPEMHPGRDCLGCHAALARGPELLVAGTVFGTLRETADCAGVHGATVIIKDAAGTEHRLESNPMGNFYLTRNAAPGFKTPFQARLLRGGKELPMYTPQSQGSCNSCHTAKGSGPPGRVCIAPGGGGCKP